MGNRVARLFNRRKNRYQMRSNRIIEPIFFQGDDHLVAAKKDGETSL